MSRIELVGCGKSTLLRMIAGLEDISAGEIRIGGKVANRIPAKQRDLVMVFQSYALYPHMNVADNMSFALKLARVPKAEIRARVAQAAEILGMGDLLDRVPRELSGGQRQRVAMGRAIVRDPKAFLFDEPLSNLDAKLRVKMRAEIKKLHKRLGKTMIYVTHDQTEAMTMADRIVVLNQGDIAQIGRPLEIYRNPDNAFVAAFIGSPEINLMAATSLGPKATQVRLTDGTQMPLAAPISLSECVALTYGIRQQHVDIVDQGIPAEVIVVEPTGEDQHLILRLAGQDFAVVAGNMLSLQLGDFGADVIKIEPPSGDSLRAWLEDGMPLFWKTYGRNKRSVVLNLRHAPAMAALKRLIETADVFIENYRPGTLEKMGLAPEKLLQINPDLIVARISGFGQTGPYAQLPGFGTVVEAISGYADRSGYEGASPRCRRWPWPT